MGFTRCPGMHFGVRLVHGRSVRSSDVWDWVSRIGRCEKYDFTTSSCCFEEVGL